MDQLPLAGMRHHHRVADISHSKKITPVGHGQLINVFVSVDLERVNANATALQQRTATACRHLLTVAS